MVRRLATALALFLSASCGGRVRYEIGQQPGLPSANATGGAANGDGTGGASLDPASTGGAPDVGSGGNQDDSDDDPPPPGACARTAWNLPCTHCVGAGEAAPCAPCQTESFRFNCGREGLLGLQVERDTLFLSLTTDDPDASHYEVWKSRPHETWQEIAADSPAMTSTQSLISGGTNVMVVETQGSSIVGRDIYSPTFEWSFGVNVPDLVRTKELVWIDGTTLVLGRSSNLGHEQLLFSIDASGSLRDLQPALGDDSPLDLIEDPSQPQTVMVVAAETADARASRLYRYRGGALRLEAELSDSVIDDVYTGSWFVHTTRDGASASDGKGTTETVIGFPTLVDCPDAAVKPDVGSCDLGAMDDAGENTLAFASTTGDGQAWIVRLQAEAEQQCLPRVSDCDGVSCRCTYTTSTSYTSATLIVEQVLGTLQKFELDVPLPRVDAPWLDFDVTDTAILVALGDSPTNKDNAYVYTVLIPRAP